MNRFWQRLQKVLWGSLGFGDGWYLRVPGGQQVWPLRNLDLASSSKYERLLASGGSSQWGELSKVGQLR